MNIQVPNKLIFLWCVPRSVSTAFEKMMACSGMFEVIGEPFIDTYKHSLLSESHFRQASNQFERQYLELMAKSDNGAVFTKDMAYHAEPFISDALIEAATHTFLIRDPQLAIPSLFRMRPDYSEDQPGFEGQFKLFKRIERVKGTRPLVMDAEMLTANAPEIIAEYFSHIGYDCPQNILSWPQGSRDDWAGRESWHLDAINSQGFNATRKAVDLSGLPTRVLASVERNKVFYNKMRKHIARQ